ncbi:hypothetical protein Q7P37_004243 [Cladosporium fusiforme]
MSTGLLFVTAPEADHKSINLILLQIRDWGYGSGDSFKLVTTKNAYDLDVSPINPHGRLEPTSPPLDSRFENAWAGASLEDVEAFCLDLKREGPLPYNASLYIMVDSEGLQALNGVLGKQASDFEADKFRYLDVYNKMRIPWDQVYMVWCNLDISNMDFEEYTKEIEAGVDEDGNVGVAPGGWFSFEDGFGDDFFVKEDKERRDKEIEQFRQDGLI